MAPKLISTSAAYDLIQNKRLVHILDTTYTLNNITPIENHFKHRLPTSQYLDVKNLSDSSTGLTMTMPTQSHFIEFMRKLKVKNDDVPVLLYDHFNMTSPRAWFMFQVFGRKNVAVLDGGLSKWLKENLPIDSGKYNFNEVSDTSAGYEYVKNPGLLKGFEEVQQNLTEKKFQVLDARPSNVFNENKIQNSLNSPFDTLYNEDLTFKSPDQLREHYARIGLDLSKEVVNSCRIGHSASVNLFALELIGKSSKLYDGSWEEWSKRHKPSST